VCITMSSQSLTSYNKSDTDSSECLEAEELELDEVEMLEMDQDVAVDPIPTMVELFDKLGVPNHIKHHPISNAKSKVWQFFRKVANCTGQDSSNRHGQERKEQDIHSSVYSLLEGDWRERNRQVNIMEKGTMRPISFKQCP
jgi:hypothetical protein